MVEGIELFGYFDLVDGGVGLDVNVCCDVGYEYGYDCE